MLVGNVGIESFDFAQEGPMTYSACPAKSWVSSGRLRIRTGDLLGVSESL